MNEDALERAGAKPLQPLLDTIGKAQDAKGLFAAVAALHKHAIFPFFEVSSQQDFKDATLVIAALDQSGLGLPNRGYSYFTALNVLFKQEKPEAFRHYLTSVAVRSQANGLSSAFIKERFAMKQKLTGQHRSRQPGRAEEATDAPAWQPSCAGSTGR